MTTKSLFHKKSNDIKKVKIFPDKLPEKTDIWCWWCCHPFENKPVSMPISYDNSKDTFELMGVFCSFSCCKAYILSSPIYDKPIIIGNIKVLAKKMGQDYKKRIVVAPPRQLLKVFGGDLTIDEFRKKCNDNIALNILTSNQIITTQYTEEKSIGNIQIQASQLSINEKNRELFSLKRNKPLKAKKGSLQEAMGLTIK